MSIIKKILENIFNKKEVISEKEFFLKDDINYEIKITNIYACTYQDEEIITTEMPLFNGAPSQYIKLTNKLEDAFYTNAKGTIQGTLKNISTEGNTKTSVYSFNSLGEKTAKTEIRIAEVEEGAISEQINIEPVVTITNFLENGNVFGAFIGLIER